MTSVAALMGQEFMVWGCCCRAACVDRRRSFLQTFGFVALALIGAGSLTALPLADALAQAETPGFRPGQEGREKLQPKVRPELELFVPEATGADIPEEVASIKVVITRLEVVGVSMFDFAELQPLTDKPCLSG